MAWNAPPTEAWNRPAHWHEYYRELLAGSGSWRRGIITYRDADRLVRTLRQCGELPTSTPQTLLDAGCGITVVPHILACWGFRVTAVDCCERAIEVAAQYEPTEEQLARCLPIWEDCQAYGGQVLVEDPARSLQRLRDFMTPGGTLTYLADDWLTADLSPGSFGIVHCCNGLRCSTKPYWRASLRRFHDLLVPGGLLILETLNAIGIMDEVEELLAECSFLTPMPGRARHPAYKYVVSLWPTG
jgi:SAM-dependent methyltransferase